MSINLQKTITLALIFTLVNCGGLGAKSSSQRRGSSEAEQDQRVEYLPFEEVLSKLQESDLTPDSIKKTINRNWLWQNLYAHIPSLKEDQRAALESYLDELERPEQTNSSSDLQLASSIKIPESEDFSIELPPHHSVRIPVTSFCLHKNKSPPSSRLRYKVKPLKSESLSRQILFKYLDSREDDKTFQGLMWALEQRETRLSSLPRFTAILDELDFDYDRQSTLAAFEESKATVKKTKELGVGNEDVTSEVQISLVSTQGYTSGDLILFNLSNSETHTITPKNLNVSMEPSYQNGKDTGPTDLEDKYQSIYVSGTDPSRIDATERDNERRAREANELAKKIEDMSRSGQFDETQQMFVDAAQDLGAQFAAQGETEVADRLNADLENFFDTLETGVDWATALTPGVNDLRDIYELTTGLDLVTGETLSTGDRVLAAVGLVAGSGVAYRKGIDAIARATGLSDDAYHGARKTLDGAADAQPVKTPYGAATQEMTPNAVVARGQVEQGDNLYRIGKRNQSETGDGAQFWSLEHPNTSGYADRYGIPQRNIDNADFIEIGKVKPGSPYVTRSAPPSPDGVNAGGGIEVVTEKGGVKVESHSSIGDD